MRPLLQMICFVVMLLSLCAFGDDKMALPAEGDKAVQNAAINLLYLGKAYPEPEPLSLMQTIPVDNGVAGAKLAVLEVNVTGRFVGR